MTTRRALKPPPVVPLVRVHGTEELNRIQANVDRATQEARALPQNKGRSVTVAMPATGPVTVNHGLGRKPVGWNQQSATGANNPSYRETGRTTRKLTFESAAECSVELWIF